MLRTYTTLKQIIGDQAAKETIKILVVYFGYYITTEEIQQLNIIF